MHKFLKATIDDIDILEDIERQCFNDPWNAEMLFSELIMPHATFLLLFIDGNIGGYLSYLHILDELHIMNVAVLESYRHKGYGSIMLKRIIDDAKRLAARAITLEVRESNIAAIKLYESHGFTCSGIRPRYYMDKENALIYWLEL